MLLKKQLINQNSYNKYRDKFLIIHIFVYVWLLMKSLYLITEINMKLLDLKIYGLNGLAMALNFSSIEIGLKIILSLVVIGYTIHKWYIMSTKNKQEDTED